jgi:hypothetical protein
MLGSARVEGKEACSMVVPDARWSGTGITQAGSGERIHLSPGRVIVPATIAGSLVLLGAVAARLGGAPIRRGAVATATTALVGHFFGATG